VTVLNDQLTIRPAQAADLGRVVEIYNAGIAERVATFETSPRMIEDIESWAEDGQPFRSPPITTTSSGGREPAPTPTDAPTRASASTPCTSTRRSAAAGSVVRS
jgi:hypothetical protein